MNLPETVLELMQVLHRAGFEAWVVGGCVRDSVLGITPHDYDMCSSATPRQMQQVFADRHLVLAGVRHGTVGVCTDAGVVEITTFRTEGDYADSRHPDWVRFVSTVQEDLSRRDFTINAMAYCPERGYADPFGGMQDLQAGILRAVGDPVRRFQEDALRILRGVRFAARFRLEIHRDTWDAMVSEAAGLDALARERVFEELSRLLVLVDAELLLKIRPILARVIPQLEPTMGFCQHSPHHAFDVFTHTAHVVENVPTEPVLRFAALLHDVGKPACFTMDGAGCGHFHGHAQAGAELADCVLHELKAPTAFREEAVWLVAHHMDDMPLQTKAARRVLSRYGIERVRHLAALQMADLSGKGVVEAVDGRIGLRESMELLEQLSRQEGQMSLKKLAVHGQDLLQLGYAADPKLGRVLDQLLELVMEEQLPNEKQALLAQAQVWLSGADG